MKTTILFSLLLFVVVRSPAKEPPPNHGLDGIDAVIEQELKTFQVPGVAVAVVVGDYVVLSKGYGPRDVESAADAADADADRVGRPRLRWRRSPPWCGREKLDQTNQSANTR